MMWLITLLSLMGWTYMWYGIGESHGYQKHEQEFLEWYKREKSGDPDHHEEGRSNERQDQVSTQAETQE